MFQGPKVVVNRFGWNLAQKLGVMRYFPSHFGSLLWLLVLELQEGPHFLPFEHQKSTLPGGILNPTGKLCCQMNLTMNSTITELSVYAWKFVLKVLHREEPGARVWPKIDAKITTQNSHFLNFQYVHLLSCITSIPIPLFTLVTQLSLLLYFWNKHFMFL